MWAGGETGERSRAWRQRKRLWESGWWRGWASGRPCSDAHFGLQWRGGKDERGVAFRAIIKRSSPDSIYRPPQDSRAAAVVMRVLRAVAATGRTVICTIHQPSSELFLMFDDLLLLQRGGYEVRVALGAGRQLNGTVGACAAVGAGGWVRARGGARGVVASCVGRCSARNFNFNFNFNHPRRRTWAPSADAAARSSATSRPCPASRATHAARTRRRGCSRGCTGWRA